MTHSDWRRPRGRALASTCRLTKWCLLIGLAISFVRPSTAALAAGEHLTLTPGDFSASNAGGVLADYLTATLTDANGQPMSGRSITFTLSGGACSTWASVQTTDASGQAFFLVQPVVNGPGFSCGNWGYFFEGRFTVLASFIDEQGLNITSNTAQGVFYYTGAVSTSVSGNFVVGNQAAINISAPSPGIHPTATIQSGPDVGETLRVLCGGSSGCTNGVTYVQNNFQPGTDVVQFSYTNILGQTFSSQQSLTWLRPDVTPPVTSATLSGPTGANNWYVGPVTLTLTATDPSVAPNTFVSGVASTAYSVDNGMSWVVYNSKSPPVFAKDGRYTVEYHSTDFAGNVEAAKTIKFNLDQTPPVVSCRVSPNVLWPPDHQLVTESATVDVQDAMSGPAGFKLVSVTSNESDTPAGDIVGWTNGTADTSGQLVAERDGNGAGRIYTLVYLGADQAGNTASCSTTVTVPHDQESTP